MVAKLQKFSDQFLESCIHSNDYAIPIVMLSLLFSFCPMLFEKVEILNL